MLDRDAQPLNALALIVVGEMFSTRAGTVRSTELPRSAVCPDIVEKLDRNMMLFIVFR